MRHITCLLVIFLLPVSILAQDKTLEVYYEKDRNKPGVYNFYCSSDRPGKTKLTVTFSTLQNMRLSSGGRDYIGTVSRGNRRIFSLKPTRANARSNFRYSYSSMPGCHKTKHDKKAVYLMPLSESATVHTRGITYLGASMGENEPEGFYSIGFDISPGDTIFAARKGVVIEMYDEASIRESKSVQFKRNKNYIIVQHEDCTMARYNDLGNEILVEEGQIVYPRQPISIAGESDYISGSHIKFSIYYPSKSKRLKNGKETGKYFNYAYVTPNFLTQVGKQVLQPNIDYKNAIDQKYVTKEMSKKEKKKYKKGELY